MKSIGTQVGWGFHFQNKYFLIFITTITFIFSLNLLGLFEIILPQNLMQKIYIFSDNNKRFSNFFTGIFSTLMATPCSAPFLGTAVGFSMVGSYSTIMLIFFTISIGFALPYICFLIFSNFIKFFPKPGNWMLNFKLILGLLLLLTFGWLLSLLKMEFITILILTLSIILISILKTKFKKNFYFISIMIACILVMIFNNSNENELLWEKYDKKRLESYINNN